MKTIEKLLISFIEDPENYNNNFQLAQHYDNIDQTAAAVSYYLRAAERSTNVSDQYYCLIKSGICFMRQGCRNFTVQGIFQQAVAIMPSRPEVYYLLSRVYNEQQKYHDAYMIASMGEKVAENSKECPDLEYPGRYAILYEKAISSYEVGLCDDSRELLTELKNNGYNTEVVTEKLNEMNHNAKGLHDVYIPERYQQFSWFNFHDLKNEQQSEIFIDDSYQKYVQVEEGDLVVDVGAGIGAFAFKVKEKNPKKVYCFEPDISKYQALVGTEYGDNIECINYLPSVKLFSEIVTKKFQHIDFLKLDCGGGEYDILSQENLPWVIENVKKISGKFNLGTPELNKKFVDFKNTYLKRFTDFQVYSLDGVDIKGSLLGDDGGEWFLSYYHRIFVHINNPSKFNGMKNTTAVWHDPIPYTKEKYDNLRYKFSGSEDLDHNYAQAYQDLFVLSMLDGKRGGCFLEIGGARPYFGNNTALLEESFNWTGVSIEYNQQFAQEYTEARKNTTMLCTDATAVDYDNILSSAYLDNVIDYLQLDIDPPDKTYEVLLKIPFDKYKFKTITYEHDYYSDSSKSYRDKSREYLESKGYVLVVDNISPDENSPFEDWWVHPDFINPYIMDKMKMVDGKTKYVEDYMFPGKSTATENDIFRLAVKSDTVWVVDNFYENPDAVRKFALEQDYHIGGIGRGYIGNRTHQQFLFPGLKERFEQIMGKKITKWKEHGMNGRFQYCWSGQPLVYHCDSQKWGGVLYLTPGAPFECGTTLHAHKKTRARNYNEDGWDASWSPDIPGDPHLDGTPFEPVDVLGNVYNRLIIFDASSIHSASEYFGTVKENCRLWQMFFFDAD